MHSATPLSAPAPDTGGPPKLYGPPPFGSHLHGHAAAGLHAPYRGAIPTPRPTYRPARTRPASALELAAAVAVAVTVDVALYDGAGGYGLALFFGALPALALLVARGRRWSLATAVTAALVVMVAARCALAPNAPTVFAGVALLLAFGATLHMRASLFDVLLSAPLAFAPSNLGAFGAGLSRAAKRVRLSREVVVPIAVPVALVGVFALVFAAANPVVARIFDRAVHAFDRFVTLPTFPRVLLAVFALAAAPALLRPGARRVRVQLAAARDGEATAISLGVARNALVGLNVLFFLYNALDATSLVTRRPPAGVDLQTYAHQGTAWLTVALLLTTVVLGVMFRGTLAHDEGAKRIRTLAYVWVAQGLVLALGTYGRIAMHIGSSGLSDLRIVGVLGTTLVVGGLVLVALKLRHGRSFAWLTRRQFEAFALAWMVWAIVPTHLVSAKVDVARIEAGELRPLVHLDELAGESESAPALVPLLRHPDPRVREGVAILLQDARGRLERRRADAHTWAGRDYATSRAARQLDGVKPELDAILAGVDTDAARGAVRRLSGAANYGSEADVRAVTAAPRTGSGDAARR